MVIPSHDEATSLLQHQSSKESTLVEIRINSMKLGSTWQGSSGNAIARFGSSKMATIHLQEFSSKYSSTKLCSSILFI